MCHYKSEVEKYNELMALYEASFQSITEEMDLIKEKFQIMLKKDDTLKSIGMEHPNELGLQLFKYNEKGALPANLTKEELTEIRWYQRFLSAYDNNNSYERYYENGFDYFPTHIVTAGEPDKFKLFRWGLIPPFINDRINTLNCISEEMYEKPSFRDPLAKGQRCLIPIKGFFEWRHLDEKGTIKVPYYVTFRDQQIRSMAGLYNRYKNPATGEYYYSYTILTCPANTIMEYVHNSKKRMPVFIDKENHKDWLNRDLKKDDIMDLCKPYQDPAMRAYTISKHLTTRNVNLNVPEVLIPFNYNVAIQQTHDFLERGEKKNALLAFKEAINAEKAKEEDLRLIVTQEVKAELTMA